MAKIYLSNWASHRTPGHHGPGHKWTIMAKPGRAWERGEGVVWRLAPNVTALELLHKGVLSIEQYKERYINNIEHVHSMHLSYGMLDARLPNGLEAQVYDGDTLCCVCSRAAADRDECHRVWAAKLLHTAGWEVVLDGELLVGAALEA